MRIKMHVQKYLSHNHDRNTVPNSTAEVLNRLCMYNDILIKDIINSSHLHCYSVLLFSMSV